MNWICWRMALLCFILGLIVSSVIAQGECDKPLQFTNKAMLDRYIRCIKAKAGIRYGKRASSLAKTKSNWLISEKPSDTSYNHFYRMFQAYDN